MQQSYDTQGDRVGLLRLSGASNIVKAIGIAPALLAAGTLMETIERYPVGGTMILTAYLAWLGHSIAIARFNRPRA